MNSCPQQGKSYENLIKRFFWENFSVENPDLPKMLCSNCIKKSSEFRKADSKNFLFTARPKYEGMFFLIKIIIILLINKMFAFKKLISCYF